MLTLLPGVLENTFEGLSHALSRLEGIVPTAQIDVADGVFVPETTWNKPEQLKGYQTEMRFDVHLMIDRPEKVIESWNLPSIFRLTFHHEATYDVRRTARLVKSFGKEVGVALNPDTSIDVVSDVIDEIDLVLLMSVTPGSQGRPFDPNVVQRVQALHEAHPELVIGVDGGITPVVVKPLTQAGASILISGSYILNAPDIREALTSLQDAQT